jgi:hypothetical protein
MKLISIIAAVLVCLLAGCRTHPPTEPAGPGRAFEAGDDFKIEAAVCGYLLEKHPWDGDACAAIFLEASDDRAAALIRRFPKHIPPLKPISKAERRPNQAPTDKETDKPGVILSVKAVEPGNSVSEAIGTWDAGGGASGLYAFVLVKVEGQWTIQSVK